MCSIQALPIYLNSTLLAIAEIDFKFLDKPLTLATVYQRKMQTGVIDVPNMSWQLCISLEIVDALLECSYLGPAKV